MRRARLILLLTTLLAAGQVRAGAPVEPESLGALLEARGAPRPERFMAVVLTLPPRGQGAGVVRRFDYENTGGVREGWWPASTVKLFAAIAALEATHRLGLPPRARATFHHEDRDPRTLRVDFLVRQALVPSNNLCFDLLVELVGSEALNDRFLTAGHGLGATTLLRSYAGRVRHPELGTGSSRWSPAVTLRHRGREHRLPARRDDAARDCPDEGNCTTLADLAEALRRVMLHEALAPSERFDLGPAELEVLRDALRRRKPRGNGVVDGLRRGFGAGLKVWHKPGYSRGWFSDVVFVGHRRSGRRWLVAMAGYRGRDALDGPARHVGALLRAGALDPPSPQPDTPR